MLESTWPPSLEALGPSPEDQPSGYSAVDRVRRQHRELTALLIDISRLAENLADEASIPIPVYHRLQRLLRDLTRLLEDHRDHEESTLFLLLQTRRPNLGPSLDDLGEEHVEIFRDNRVLNETLERLEPKPGIASGQAAVFLPALNSFLLKLWEHTLAEEALLRKASL